jgi:hypothetical protein
MRNRTPIPRDKRPPIPDFTPVPRKYRHDGWTPERQRAFIEALADCGSVTRAAAQVNIAQANAYALRRAPGAEEFRRAWDAALDFGVLRLKDIAFERAIEGQLVPVFVAGRLMGFRRKRNDALLMFCLRHYGQDASGKRTTINYFSTRASAGASAVAGASDLLLPGRSAACPSPEGVGLSSAEASTTTVRTVITGPGGAARRSSDAAAALLNGFDGVPLDAEAHAAIAAALEACAARARAILAADERGGVAGRDAIEDDPDEPFLRVPPGGLEYRGELEPAVGMEEFVPFGGDEGHWRQAGDAMPDWAAQLADSPARKPPAAPAAEADEGA